MRKFSFTFLQAMALHNISTWRVVKRELIGLPLCWIYCLVAPHVLDLGLGQYVPRWLLWLFTDLFWPTVASSIVTVVKASLRSALVAMVALALVLPALLLSLPAAGILLFFAVLGFAVHAWAIYSFLRRREREHAQLDTKFAS